MSRVLAMHVRFPPVRVLALAAGALLAAGCQLHPGGRCDDDDECRAGTSCVEGVCLAVPPAPPPAASADAWTVEEDTLLRVAPPGVLANDADPGGGALTASLESGPASGSLTLHPDGGFEYAPPSDAAGVRSFTYRVTNAAHASATAAVTLTILPVPDVPIALDDAYVAQGGTRLEVPAALGVLANDEDADGDALAAALIAGPVHGTLALAADGGFSYAAAPGHHGQDTFTYRVSDGASSSAPATVTLTVLEQAFAPVAAADAYTTDEDAVLVVPRTSGVLANDADANGDRLTATLVTGPAQGELTLGADGGFEYRPAPDRHGTDAFTYRASDGALLSEVTRVELAIRPVNDAPAAAPDAYATAHATALTVAPPGVLANDRDAEADALTAVLTAPPARGTLALDPGGGFTFTPEAGFSGEVTFAYAASDGVASSTPVTVRLTVAYPPGQSPPVALDDAYVVAQGGILDVPAPGALGNDGDAEGQALTFVLRSSPAHGRLVVEYAGSAFRYVPVPSFVGTDGFDYEARDSTGLASGLARVTLSVTDRNLPPVAKTEALTTAPGVAVSATLRATDPDGDPLTFTLASPPAHGAVTVGASTGAITYTPHPGYSGGDQLTFTVSDGALVSLPAQVSIDVTPARPRWTQAGIPAARTQHSAVWTGSELIVYGGRDGVGVLEGGARLAPEAGVWRALPRTASSSWQRWGHTAVWTGTEMIFWGGWSGGAVSQSGRRYNPAADAWTAVSTAGAPGARTGHTAIWTGTEMIVWGGGGAASATGGGAYNPATNTWRPLATAGAPGPRTGHSAVWTGSRLLVWGGLSGSTVLGDGAAYDPASDQWTPLPSAGAPSARQGHRAVWTGSAMVVWGGEDQAALVLGDGASFDPATGVWTPLPSAGAPSARTDPGLVWTGSRVIVWGGRGNGGALGTGAALDPAAGTWTPLPTDGAPEARVLHTSTWTGTELVVFGGTGPDGRPRSSGGRYSPSAGRWIPTPDPRAPSARARHVAVWTGAEMIVWGGGTGIYATSPTQTGGRFDPASGRWTATSTAGAPSARTGHVGFWTGSRLLVWGGDTAATAGTGGLYDPATDTWAPISTAGAPRPVMDHVAVWTGTELLVWGGELADGTYLPAGARYDPSRDAWTPMATARQPRPRAKAGAVWTGRELLVWGGVDDGQPGGCFVSCTDGAAYDPTTDTWRPTSGYAAPDGRTYPGLVWTGTQLLVWGGFDGTGGMATGGVYEAAEDAWIDFTNTAGAPVRRAPVWALWTGRELLVWGGYGTAQPGNSGGLYEPSTRTWRPIAATPPERFDHTLVWNGQLLVFGGGPGNEVWVHDP